MPSPSPRSRWDKWFAVSLVVAAVYGGVLVAVAAYRTRGDCPKESSSDFCCFYQTANYFLEHRTSTDEFGVFGSPPFLTLLMVPFTVGPAWLASILWSLANIAMIVTCAVLVDRVMVPPRISNRLIRLAAPMAAAAAYFHAALVLGQLGILVLFLLVMMWVLYEQGQEWWAGVILAVAIQVKVFPAAWLVYWVFKRRWRVAGGAAAGLVCSLLLTLLAFTPRESWRAHKQWLLGSRTIAAQAFTEAKTEDGQLKPKSQFFRYRNQALAFTLRRLLSDVQASDRAGHPSVNVVNWPGSAVRQVHVACVVALLVWLVSVLFRPAGGCSRQRLRWEAAVMMLAPLWFSPIFWVHYLPLAYPGLALLTVRLAHDRLLGRRNLLAVAGLLIWVAACVMLASPFLRAVGAQLWATILLAVVLAEQARRQ